ncbi:terminase large subunit [Lewinella sp. JB7]|uniref:terminase large subunit n=1 Tax=Lewinella sp. JB7 TaxID=2962887 RepID=UPI0020C9C1AE|nr:terminase TerL endonuclease subunit [Lewinella sp. JB7]MCP9237147.1 terminase large subunit [Lewinella sp. JB7]
MPSAVPAWIHYMEDVLTGRRLAGRLERLSVERCVRMAMDDRFTFDFAEAARVIEIFGYFRHTKGKYAGKLFELMPWQEYFLAMLYGMKKTGTDLRTFRKGLLCVPKKNGKSEFAGAIGVLMTFFENEEGAECYSAANKLDQAVYSWEAGMKILKRLRHESESINQDLALYNSTNNRNLINLANDSFFRPISSDSKTLDGVNPHLALIDEYHEAKDSSIPDNMESGSVAREQPLLLYTTTRGFNPLGPLYQFEQSCIRILEGDQEDFTLLPMIYTLDEGDDWEDEGVWEKANPGLGRTPTLDGLQTMYTKARNEGSTAEINFKTKNLNLWATVEERWIKHSDFISGCSRWDPAELAGLRCFGGLDLGKTRDFTAIAYLFPPQAHFDRYRVLMRYFLPEESAEELIRKDMVPYFDWQSKGYITLTPGNVIDLDYIFSVILQDHALFDLKGMSYDPWNATHLATKLTAEEVRMNEFRQNTGTFNEPITKMENVILTGELDHAYNPVLGWNFGNVVLYRDPNGNVKFDKNRSRSKIDGAVALAEAFGEYLDFKLEETPEFTISWM